MAKKKFVLDGGDVPHQPITLGGLLIADGLSELLEIGIEDLGVFGLHATGLTALKEVLTKIGGDNKYVVHGLDMSVRLGLQRFFPDQPVLRETLISVSDAYFDKLRLLPPEPSEPQLQRAKAEGMKNGLLKIKEFVAKKNAKPSFEKLYTQLETGQRSALSGWMAWMCEHAKHRHQEWLVLRERIGTLQVLEDVVDRIESQPDRDALTNEVILFLEGLYGHKPTIVDTLTALAQGESTPHTQALERRAQVVLTQRTQKADEAAAKLKATKAKYRW
jgi:hypothetical protein